MTVAEYTPTQELIMEVLMARRRLGHPVWTLKANAAVTSALQELQARGLLGWKSGVVERTYLAWLTDAGEEEFADPNYVPPVLADQAHTTPNRATFAQGIYQSHYRHIDDNDLAIELAEEATDTVLGLLAGKPTVESVRRDERERCYREWFTTDPVLARGYWLVPCDDCDGTGRFPVPDGYDGDSSCVRCKAQGEIPLSMAGELAEQRKAMRAAARIAEGNQK